MRWTSVGIIAVLFFASTIRAAPIVLDDDDPLRLPRNSIPIHYDITLTTNVHNGERNFDGVVIIEIKITAETDTLTLHNRGLTPLSYRLYDNSLEDVAINISADASRDFFFITAEKVLQVDELYFIEIAYNGQLGISMNGFYISSYRIGTETR